MLACSFFIGSVPLAADTGLKGLIARLDQIRIPGRDLASELEIRHYPKPAQPPETSAFRLFTRISGEPGRQNIATLMICTAPPRDAGKRILFRDDACWFFDPHAKRPVKISAAQMWSQPMASDSPNWRLAEDFSAESAGREEIVCGDGVTRRCSVIDFVPVSKAMPAPARMRYWVDDSGRYWRVEHFTAGGRLFKTIDNIRYGRVLECERVASMRIRSGPETAEATFSGIEARTSPRAWFEPDGLAQIPP
ncbi:MAG: outer membrane lipoprotein-sorting protein [Verrucomicrobia bacterium]|nr:outer membrane lipoprotein-sorting protein [Verrucomicrobiota bacterium]